MSTKVFAVAAAAIALASACAPPSPIFASSTPSVTEPRHGAREKGCRVDVVSDRPPNDRADLGMVEADCEMRVGTEACERALYDEVCKLGGTMVWGVAPIEKSRSKLRLRGQAAIER